MLGGSHLCGRPRLVRFIVGYPNEHVVIAFPELHHLSGPGDAPVEVVLGVCMGVFNDFCAAVPPGVDANDFVRRLYFLRLSHRHTIFTTPAR